MGKRNPHAGKKEGRDASKSQYRVFISHATADKWIARVIRDKLKTWALLHSLTTATLTAAMTFRTEFARKFTGRRN